MTMPDTGNTLVDLINTTDGRSLLHLRLDHQAEVRNQQHAHRIAVFLHRLHQVDPRRDDSVADADERRVAIGSGLATQTDRQTNRQTYIQS